MHGDHMPDQFLQCFGGILLFSGEVRQILTQAYFVAIHRKLIEPDALLRELGIVELRP